MSGEQSDHHHGELPPKCQSRSTEAPSTIVTHDCCVHDLDDDHKAHPFVPMRSSPFYITP